jgi:hypothetical protein
MRADLGVVWNTGREEIKTVGFPEPDVPARSDLGRLNGVSSAG